MNWKRIWGEIFPGDLEAHLEALHEEALELARKVRARRNPMQLQPHDKLATDVQTFFKGVRDRDDIIGVSTGTRILRHGAKEVFGLDPSADRASINQAAEWLDLVVENIEYLLSAIDRRRTRWLTLCSTVTATVAALLALLGLVVGVVALFKM